jgi:hypothetical protein
MARDRRSIWASPRAALRSGRSSVKRELPMSDEDVAMRIAVASAFRDCGPPSDEQDVDDFLVALRSFGYVVERLDRTGHVLAPRTVWPRRLSVGTCPPVTTCKHAGMPSCSTAMRRHRRDLLRPFSRWSEPSIGGRPTASGRLWSVQPRTCLFSANVALVALIWFDQFTWHKQISLALSVNNGLG